MVDHDGSSRRFAAERPDHTVANCLDRLAELVARVTALKQQPGGELQVQGSGMLAQTLIAAGLVDAYQLPIFPAFVGSGRRLFADQGPAGALRLVASQTTPTGVTIQTYEAAGALRQASFADGPEPEPARILR